MVLIFYVISHPYKEYDGHVMMMRETRLISERHELDATMGSLDHVGSQHSLVYDFHHAFTVNTVLKKIGFNLKTLC